MMVDYFKLFSLEQRNLLTMAKIIGITGGGNHHDAGISYIDNGKIKYAVSEERPRRQKNYKIIHEKPTDSIRVFERDNNMKLNDADNF